MGSGPATLMRRQGAVFTLLGGMLLALVAWYSATRAPEDPAAALPPAAELPAPPGPCERFIVCGDAGHAGPGQQRVAAAKAAWARRGGLDYAVSARDNFYGEGLASVDDPQWRSEFKAVYDIRFLDVPFSTQRWATTTTVEASTRRSHTRSAAHAGVCRRATTCCASPPPTAQWLRTAARVGPSAESSSRTHSGKGSSYAMPLPRRVLQQRGRHPRAGHRQAQGDVCAQSC